MSTIGKWFCAQIGAREHYAVPRVLNQSGRLATLYTDFWAGPLLRFFANQIPMRTARSFAGRFHAGLSQAQVVSWNLQSLKWEMDLRRKNADLYSTFAQTGSNFAINVRNVMKHRKDISRNTIFFGYDTGALETLQWCRERGIKCILNQMDPNRVEVELVRREEKLWPEWSIQSLEVPEAYFSRREKEWDAADKVIVNSIFCRDALISQGVPSKKLVVIPLSFESGDRFDSPAKGGSINKLRVLYLGQVILRKGIQYLAQAAKLLENENIEFNIVGPIGISRSAIAAAPKNMIFHGRTTRDEVSQWYQSSDVFVLPTLSDGFAITQLEAMAHGLPVVTTSCCGAVVSDGQDGFIVPARAPEILARVFQRYLTEPELLRHQKDAARVKVKQFTPGHLERNLISLESQIMAE